MVRKHDATPSVKAMGAAVLDRTVVAIKDYSRWKSMHNSKKLILRHCCEDPCVTAVVHCVSRLSLTLQIEMLQRHPMLNSVANYL